jgi:RecA-family ATPase
MSDACPEGFSAWPLDQRNAFFASRARAYDEERRGSGGAEWARAPKLAIGGAAPPPVSEDDYGEQAPHGPFDDVAPEGEPSESVELPVISAAAFAGVEPPERRWIVKDMIPDRTVTIVSGDGGGGKTTLKLHLAVAIAGRCPWLGHNPDPGPVLFVTAEDEEEEIHRRIYAIAKGLNVELSDLVDLHIVPLAGQDAVMGAPEGKAALITPTAVFRGLVALVERIRPRLVILDALADVYAGEENARAQARQFIGLLRGLAIRNDLAVVLIAHPSLSGMASGSGTSGSTAWSNSVRARLYLERVLDEGNREIDPDLRVLRVKKSNYGPVGLELRLRSQNGAFVLDGPAGGFDKLAADSKAERVFLDLLAAFEAQGRDVSPNLSNSYAPSVFEKHPQAEGVTRRQFIAAMERLLASERVRVETSGPPSRRHKRLTIAPAKEET